MFAMREILVPLDLSRQIPKLINRIRRSRQHRTEQGSDFGDAGKISASGSGGSSLNSAAALIIGKIVFWCQLVKKPVWVSPSGYFAYYCGRNLRNFGKAVGYVDIGIRRHLLATLAQVSVDVVRDAKSICEYYVLGVRFV